LQQAIATSHCYAQEGYSWRRCGEKKFYHAFFADTNIHLYCAKQNSLSGLFRRYKLQYIFAFITLIYIFFRWITFKGFNGTDDLHYAMLASDMLKGNYSPFNVNDIFAGRVLLISFQAFIYFIGGVNVFTTQAGTLLATVLCCYLTVFKLIPNTNNNNIIGASALFYFNPVLSESNFTVMPDVYVMLAGIIVLLLWKKILKERNKARKTWKGILIGVIVFAGMFLKETALIYIPFLFCVAFIDRRDSNLQVGFISILTFCLLVFFAGCIYYHYTNDFFFRVRQIQNSDYPSPCNYNFLPTSELVRRLTYGEWIEFIIRSFYPVILSLLMLLLSILFTRRSKILKEKNTQYFIILTILTLYFPFSLNGYQPLCFEVRHFLFLLPFSVSVTICFLENAWNNKRILWLFIASSFILLGLCITNTGEKWYWMMYGFLLLYFAAQKFLSRDGLLYKLRYVAFASTLLIYMPYHLFFTNSNWFKNIQWLSEKLSGNYFYFPEHDNMQQWKLIHGFESSFHSYNLEKKSFKVFTPYYEQPDTASFHPGWFIVNQKYTVRSDNFLQIVNNLNQQHFFVKQISCGDVDAFYIDTSVKLNYIRKIIEKD
jgi:hypothetical protein